MKTFQPIRGQVQNIYTVPVDGPLKSTLKDASLSDATSGQSNKLASFSTTRLQSLQTGITTPDCLVLSQQDCQNKGPTPPPRRSDLDGDAPATSRGATPSKKTLKHFTSVFQLRYKASVPLLTKRLLEHQEELRSRGTKSEDSPPPPPQTQNVTPQNLEDSSEKCVTLPNQKKKLRLKVGSGIGAMNNMDGSPPSLGNHKMSEHKECGQMVEKENGSEWRKEDSVPVMDEEMHECIWRRLFLEEQGGRGGFDGNGNGNQIETDGGRAVIRGIRLVIQLLGKEELVLEGEF